LGIAFGSINTGLPKDIVQQIMKAERIPVDKMIARKGKIENKQKLLDELAGYVSDLRVELKRLSNDRELRELNLNFNENLISVTADKNAANVGSHQFEVVQLAQKSSIMTNGFENKDDSYLGVGYIKYWLPNGDSKEIYVDADNSSLTKVAALINSDNSNGLRANVINDGSGENAPWRLIISLVDSGDENLVEFPYFYFVDGEDDLYIDHEREAHDAIVKLDGFPVHLRENKTSDLIPGLNIDLKKASPGEEFTIGVVIDEQLITTKFEDLIEKINKVLSFIKSQNTLDQSSDTSQTLGGDITIQSIESRLRSAIFRPVDTDFGMKRFGDIGVKFQRTGLLKFDPKKFEHAVAQNYSMIAQIFLGKKTDEFGIRTQGIIQNLIEFANSSLRVPDGILTTRKNGLNSNKRQIDKQIESRERIIKQKEKNLRNKFSRLESTISRIKSQGAGLAGLQGGGFNPVQKLG